MTTLDTREMVAFNAGEAPGLELIQNHVYPYAETYVGYVEEVTFTFKLLPDEVPGTSWFRDQIINAFESKVTEQGAHMIALQVWEDKTPTWHTDYKVIATATASPLPWAIIIVGVLAIVFLIALNFTITNVSTFLWGEEGQPPAGFGDMVLMLVVMVVMSVIMGFLKEPRKLEGG